MALVLVHRRWEVIKRAAGASKALIPLYANTSVVDKGLEGNGQKHIIKERH